MAVRIMIFEDEGIIAQDLKLRLEKMNYVVPAMAVSGKNVLEKVEKARPDLIFMDIMLKGKTDGIDLAAKIREHHDIPIVFLTALSDEKTLERAKETEPYNYLLKPFHDTELKISIEMALSKHAKDKVKLSRERWLRSVLQSMGEAILIVDKEGEITFANEEAARLLDTTVEELKVSDIRLWLSDPVADPQQSFFAQLLELFRGDAASVRQAVVLRSLKDHLPGEAIATPVATEPNAIPAVTIVLRPATETDQTETYSGGVQWEKLDVPLAIQDPFILQSLTNAPNLRREGNNIIRTFGDFRMKLDGKTVDLTAWRSKKAVDALAFLLLHYPSPVHKEVLISFLWPEVSLKTGISRLHHVISELRKYLSPESQRYQRKSFIQYSHNEYRFDPLDQVILDLVMFEELVKVGNRMWNSNNRDRAFVFYAEARLWKSGDLFPKYRYEEEFENKRLGMNQMEETAQERLEEAGYED